MKKWFIPLLGIIALIVAACQQPAPSPDPEPQTIADVAQDNEDLSILVEALVAAELVATLEGEGPFTVFAPTNAAFEALLEAQGVADLDGLIAALGAEAVTDILLYHVVVGVELDAETVIATAPNLLGSSEDAPPIYYDVVDGNVVLNGSATVTTADIEASNGIIHIIDAVILPPTAVVEVTLSGDQEVPPVETDATGSATVGLFGNDTLFVKGTFSGFEIGGPGAHIHGPAPAGENAGILFDLAFNNETNSFSGIFELDDEQVGFFNGGLLYINLHSEANPAGEIRGQIVP